MAERALPRYPVYVPSKGRYESGLTMKMLIADEVPFHLVVEQQEADAYGKRYGYERLLVLPESNQGLIYARNVIKAHATEAGHARHWQLDDNIRVVYRRYRAQRIPCNSGVALRVAEDFTDRYTNVAISGLNYGMFVPEGVKIPPFYLNCRVYSCTLVRNDIPNRWRLRYNDDTDICLQVLADGWCTILLNAFLIDKIRTMLVPGGNTADLYQGDGRLLMARTLERVWPGVVETDRRFQRPQHVVKDSWRRFDTPLQLRPDIDIDALKAQKNEYGLSLKQVAPEVKSAALRQMLEAQGPAPEAPE